MYNRRHQSIADYAAIGLAPVLIFTMLSSLALFLMMVVYAGSFPFRVAQTLLFYTMGVTAIARMTIEEGRNYSTGYTVALGAAALFVMSQFFGGPISSAVVLFVIGYLADRIVHDCTIVDDSIDSSGQGLVDSARFWVQTNAMPLATSEPSTDARSSGDLTSSQAAKQAGSPPKAVAKGGQPGRTVLYLALGALPLFGIGQFFLRSDAAAWSSARTLLAIYLFASLSLLVVTSFLNLRRYLRQRNTEMPVHTTIAWLVGGMAMIGAILLLSLLAPLPGRTIASFKMPEWFKNTKPMTASQYGYGNEGAEDSAGVSPSSQGQPARTPAKNDSSDAPPPRDKPSQDPGKASAGNRTEAGAPPGGTKGNRKDGPAGNDPGGNKGKSDAKGDQKSPNGKPTQSDSKGSTAKSKGNSPSKGSAGPKSKETSKTKSETEQPNKQPEKESEKSSQGNENSKANKAPEAEQASKDKEVNDKQDVKSDNAPESKSESTDGPNQDSSQPKNDSGSKNDSSPNKPPSKPPEQPSRERTTDEDLGPDQKKAKAKPQLEKPEKPKTTPEPTPPKPSSPSSSLAGLFSFIGGLMKFLFIVLLIAIVGVYIYLNYQSILAWINEWLGGEETRGQSVAGSEPPAPVPATPPRPFSSYQNPVGKEEPQEVVVITFQALEAWGREQGVLRAEDETPSEFAKRLVKQFPVLKKSTLSIVDAYNRIVYGQDRASQKDVQAADHIWKFMRPSLEA